NMLATLGWNDGSEKEIFTIEELIAAFSVERINKSGAKYDFEKAKWYNHEWMKIMPNEELLPQVEPLFGANGAVVPNSSYLDLVLSLVKERMTYVADFWEQASFFFIAPKELDLDAIRGKWSPEKTQFFQELVTDLANFPDWKADTLAAFFKEKVANSGMKMGELMM